MIPGHGGYPGANTPLHSMILEGMRPDMPPGSFLNFPAPRQPPPQMQRTFTIRNDVNLKKGTLKLIRDAAKPSQYHVEFVFDASTDCRISVYYAAIEKTIEGMPTFLPLKEKTTHPTELRSKGLGQTFRTRASHPLDVSLYEPAELAFDPKLPQPRFPIVVCMEAGGKRNPDPTKVQSQTTFVKVIPGEGEAAFTAQPLKQKIQVGSTPYELQEIFGIDQHAKAGDGASSAEGGDGGDNSRECVICMTEARDTTVLPCRHMCMCSDCARQLRMQSNKCPICRTNIEQLLQIKISKQEAADDPAAPAAANATARGEATNAT